MATDVRQDWSFAAKTIFRDVESGKPLQLIKFQEDIRGLYQAMSNVLQTSHPGIDLLAKNIAMLEAEVPRLQQELNGAAHDKINRLVQSTVFQALIPDQAEIDETKDVNYSFFYEKHAPKKLEEFPQLQKEPLVLRWFTLAVLSILTKDDQDKMRQSLDLPPRISQVMADGRRRIGAKMLETFTKADCNQLIQLFENQNVRTSEKVQSVWREYQELFAQAKDENGDYSQQIYDSVKTGLAYLRPKLKDPRSIPINRCQQLTAIFALAAAAAAYGFHYFLNKKELQPC